MAKGEKYKDVDTGMLTNPAFTKVYRYELSNGAILMKAHHSDKRIDPSIILQEMHKYHARTCTEWKWASSLGQYMVNCVCHTIIADYDDCNLYE